MEREEGREGGRYQTHEEGEAMRNDTLLWMEGEKEGRNEKKS